MNHFEVAAIATLPSMNDGYAVMRWDKEYEWFNYLKGESMYCNRCGKPMEPHYTGCCGRCLYEEATSKMSTEEFFAMLGKANREAKKQNRKKEIVILIAIILVGFICPIVWIGYAVYKAWPVIQKWAIPSSSRGKVGFNSSQSSSSYSGGGTSGSSSSSFDGGSIDKETLIIGGDGNAYSSSGGLFCDWAGNYIERGSPFRDSRGNWVAWGQPFYDNRDHYIIWGAPFYDAGDNYVNPS